MIHSTAQASGSAALSFPPQAAAAARQSAGRMRLPPQIGSSASPYESCRLGAGGRQKMVERLIDGRSAGGKIACQIEFRLRRGLLFWLFTTGMRGF